MFDNKLLSEITDSGPLFWAGNYPPVVGFAASTRIIDRDYDFRESASEHGKYSTVSLLENDLSVLKQWPLILDEALRLIRHDAPSLLFIRFSESQFLTVYQLAAFFRRRHEVRVELVYQDVDLEGIIIYALRCTRLVPRPSLSSFEFSLITDGRRPERVKEFIDSVRKISGINTIEWKITVCGPKNIADTLDLHSEKIRFIEEPDKFLTKGWITRKKNLIVETSTAENLLIAHDRYEIPPDFLNQMFEFGADFSVMVPAQIDRNGNRFPDWVTLGSQWSWSVAGMLEYGDYHPHLYVNGGIIISKRLALLETPWSELLFWNQGEDVELTRSMTEKGIIPRLGRKVVVKVTDSRPGYVYEFSRLQYRPDVYLVPGGHVDKCILGARILEVGRLFALNKTSAIALSDAGIFASSSEWGFLAEGITPFHDTSTLTVDVGHAYQEDLLVILKSPSAPNPDIGLAVNGVRMSIEIEDTLGTFQLIGRIAVEFLQKSRMLSIKLVNAKLMQFIAFGIVQAEEALSYPVLLCSDNKNSFRALAHGWSYPEPWGVWSVEPVVILRLPVPLKQSVADITLIITAIGYVLPNGEQQKVGISCGSMPLGLFPLDKHGAPTNINLCIPKKLLEGLSVIHLVMTPLSLRTPAHYDITGDNRRIGIGLIRVDFV